jgi:hypothetical protein
VLRTFAARRDAEAREATLPPDEVEVVVPPPELRPDGLEAVPEVDLLDPAPGQGMRALMAPLPTVTPRVPIVARTGTLPKQGW